MNVSTKPCANPSGGCGDISLNKSEFYLLRGLRLLKSQEIAYSFTFDREGEREYLRQISWQSVHWLGGHLAENQKFSVGTKVMN